MCDDGILGDEAMNSQRSALSERPRPLAARPLATDGKPDSLLSGFRAQAQDHGLTGEPLMRFDRIGRLGMFLSTVRIMLLESEDGVDRHLANSSQLRVVVVTILRRTRHFGADS